MTSLPPGAGDAPRDVPLTAEEVSRSRPHPESYNGIVQRDADQMRRLCDSHERLRASLARAEAEREEARILLEFTRQRLFGADMAFDAERARAERSEAEVVRLRETLAKAAIPLEGLNMAVDWELAPPIKRLIAETCVLIRAALAPAADPGQET